MKIMFMGTPDFAVPVLEKLIASKKHEVVVVVTKPDKARGRGANVSFSPVKEVAVREGIPVLQPVKIREEQSVAELKEYPVDAAVVVAFGQILSREILDMPQYGCINVHGSLLPRWRGAAPIQWSILAGDQVTGITTMLMDEGVDTGDMLLTKEVSIGERETGGELFDRMSVLGADVLLETLEAVEAGTIQPQKQDNESSTYAKILTKELGRLDFGKPAKELERFVRGLNPWPSAYTSYEGKTLKIWDASVDGQQIDAVPGEIVTVGKESFSIKTGEGNLVVHEVQLEGKRRMKVGDFLCGIALKKGMYFE